MEFMDNEIEEEKQEGQEKQGRKFKKFSFNTKTYLLVGGGSLILLAVLFSLAGRKEIIQTSSDVQIVNRIVEEQLKAQRKMNEELLKEIRELKKEIAKAKTVEKTKKPEKVKGGESVFDLLNKRRKVEKKTADSEAQQKLKELERKLRMLEERKTRTRRTPAKPTLQFQEREVKVQKPLRTARKTSKKNLQVFIPAGSVIKGRVVSGFFAPVGTNRKFPAVLIELKGDVVAPNGFRVPLDGCRVIAKAEGDWVLERAKLQTYKLACVLPSGKVVEVQFNANIVSGIDGMDGIKGRFVNASAKQLRTYFGTTFLGTLFDSLARAQVQTQIGVEGGAVFKNEVIKNDASYALYRGLADTWKQFSKFYLEQAKESLPVVLVEGDVPVYLQVIDGFSMEVSPDEVVASSR